MNVLEAQRMFWDAKVYHYIQEQFINNMLRMGFTEEDMDEALQI